MDNSFFQTEIITKSKVTNIEEASASVTKLQELGCNTVIITLGEKGSVFATKADPTPVHVPAKKVQPVDTTVGIRKISQFVIHVVS